MGDSDGQNGTPFSVSKIGSLSDTNLSPVASKLVDHAVSTAYSDLSETPSNGTLHDAGSPPKGKKGSRKHGSYVVHSGNTSKHSSREGEENVTLSKKRGKSVSEEKNMPTVDESKPPSVGTVWKRVSNEQSLDSRKISYEKSLIDDEEPIKRQSQTGGTIRFIRESLTDGADQTGVTNNSENLEGQPTEEIRHSIEENQSGNKSAPGISTFSDSTQVLVPINPFTEESDSRFGATASFVHRHTFPVESEFGIDALPPIHRDRASVDIDVLQLDMNSSPAWQDNNINDIGDPAEIGAEQTAQHGAGDTTGDDFAEVVGEIGSIFGGDEFSGGGVDVQRVTSSTGEFLTLMDEMASQVGKKDFEKMADMSKGFFNEIYKRFADMANGATNITTGGNENRSHESSNNAAGSSVSSRLPPEVKDKLLRTLSDIKSQLDSVKHKLKK